MKIIATISIMQSINLGTGVDYNMTVREDGREDAGTGLGQ